MKLDIDTIFAMNSSGITFFGNYPAPGGGHNIMISAADVPLFVQDRVGFAAKVLGTSREQYVAWVESDGAPRCGAITKRGTRCQNIIKGGVQRPIAEWIELEGSYCSVHGGHG